jgi:hypothetical protein
MVLTSEEWLKFGLIFALLLILVTWLSWYDKDWGDPV